MMRLQLALLLLSLLAASVSRVCAAAPPWRPLAKLVCQLVSDGWKPGRESHWISGNSNCIETLELTRIDPH